MLYVQCTLMGVLENSFPSKQSKAVKMNRFTSIRLLKKFKKKTLVAIALRIIPSYKNEVEKIYSTLFIRLYYYHRHHYLYYNYYCY